MRRLASIAFGALALCVAPEASAQDGKPCVLVFTGVARGPDTTFMNVFTTPEGSRNTFIGGGVDAKCEGQGNRLLADSAEHYADRGELILIDRVRYTEPRMTMQSDRMVYYTGEDRLLATGSVSGRSSSGTRFTGPEIEYLRAKPGVRAAPSWRARGRPFVRMAPSNATSRDSVDLTADLVVSRNDSLVWASGNVIIERPELRATADSATMDEGTGFARLLRGPRIVGLGERPFTLDGVVIDLWSREQQVERVLSSGEAQVLSDSLILKGDTIDMRISDQRIDQVFVWGARATADSPTQQMEADSLEILMPGQRIRVLNAIGRAIAYSGVDTTKIVSQERDWIAGDRIVAHFDTSIAPDSAASPAIREMVATGSARSFYQLVPSSGEKGPPNLSYNRGREITVSFNAGEVDLVTVRERASGILLEPTTSDTSSSVKPTNAARRP